MILLRDAVIIDLDKDNELVITTDGCTGIGNLKEDFFPLEIKEVAWTACKVALMELISLGAKPIGYAFNHIAALEDYELTKMGIKECLKDFGFVDIPNISSSEKNFKVHQTTITIALTGIRPKKDRTVPVDALYVLLGKPLVGKEVLEFPNDLVLPREFIELIAAEGVYEVVPIGSHGVEWELEQLGVDALEPGLDMKKSAGPASCVIAAINPDFFPGLKMTFGDKIVLAGTRKTQTKVGDLDA